MTTKKYPFNKGFRQKSNTPVEGRRKPFSSRRPAHCRLAIEVDPTFTPARRCLLVAAKRLGALDEATELPFHQDLTAGPSGHTLEFRRTFRQDGPDALRDFFLMRRGDGWVQPQGSPLDEGFWVRSPSSRKCQLKKVPGSSLTAQESARHLIDDRGPLAGEGIDPRRRPKIPLRMPVKPELGASGDGCRLTREGRECRPITTSEGVTRCFRFKIFPSSNR